MSSAKVKEISDKELVVTPKKAYHEKQEPMRFKVRKVRIVDLDDTLKRIYRIKN